MSADTTPGQEAFGKDKKDDYYRDALANAKGPAERRAILQMMGGTTGYDEDGVPESIDALVDSGVNAGRAVISGAATVGQGAAAVADLVAGSGTAAQDMVQSAEDWLEENGYAEAFKYDPGGANQSFVEGVARILPAAVVETFAKAPMETMITMSRESTWETAYEVLTELAPLVAASIWEAANGDKEEIKMMMEALKETTHEAVDNSDWKQAWDREYGDQQRAFIENRDKREADQQAEFRVKDGGAGGW
jgi:hypothetical protein